MKTSLLPLLGLTFISIPSAGTAQVQTVVAGNTAFALNLYSQLATTPGNLFFSPYSISTCLAMLYAGASGNTEQQMSQVLGFGTNQQQVASLFSGLQAALATDQQTNAIELDIANALWTQQGFPFLTAFLATARNQYQANINQADFVNSSDAARQAINDWVAQETHDRIQNILAPGSLNSQTRLVLANAIYLLGVWTEAFAQTNTSTQPFYLSTNDEVEVPLMHQLSPTGSGLKFNYMQNYPYGIGNTAPTNGFQAIELPYASNKVSMLILLPSQIDGLGQLEQQLSPAFLSNVLAQMEQQPVEVFLPRFTMASSFDLLTTLAAMGMPDASTPGLADFFGIDGKKDLYLSHLFHKAWGQVNEAGTEAAAAMIGVVGTTSVGGGEPPVFRADHPFLFLIRDTQTGSVLFLGRLTNPSASDAPATRTLTVTPSAGSLKISWPASLTGLTLRQSTDLTHWTASAGVSSDGTNNSITINTSPSGSRFFRLSSP
jgi:serpin B